MSGNVLLANRILEMTKQHSRQTNIFIDYGTAGFRNKATLLDHVIFRMGIVAALRSKATKSTIGVMITASHNPEEDNGLKLVDPKGEMLANQWEQYATKVANVGDEDLTQALNELIKNENIDLNEYCSIFIGRDTRKSSLPLYKSLIDGINCISKTEVVDFGEVSTPIVHYAVVCQNTSGKYGEPTTNGYHSKLSTAFNAIVNMNPGNGSRKQVLRIDAANGVGAPVLKKTINEILPESLTIQIINDGTHGILNFECGADYVKSHQKQPVSFPVDKGVRCASFDGDADRIVYFYFDDQLKFHLLDGDKIAVLIADYLKDLVKKSGLTLILGLVQTAYANGSSTNYITDVLGLPITCCLTGVKHLHHAAHNYDVGIYFEANGHGTVVFSSKAIDLITSTAEGTGNKEAIELLNFTKLINSTVGDSISDMLTVEAILHCKGWNIEDWDALYQDRPNRLLKVQVADRTVIATTDAERICIAPKGLQQRIDSLVANYSNARSFIRPSGTEDVVRVYAEADTQENTDGLALEVALLVYEMCSGVGNKPN